MKRRVSPCVWKMSSSDLFEGLIYSHALYILSADPRKFAQIVGEQNVQSMRVKRSDPQKDQSFTFSRLWEEGPLIGVVLISAVRLWVDTDQQDGPQETATI